MSGIDVQESYIGKSKAQEWGRKIGRSAGAALSITKFIQQAFLYASSVAENADGPTLTSGGAAVVTLATAWPLATAGACVGAACYLAYKATKDPHDTDAYHVNNENPASGGDQTQSCPTNSQTDPNTKINIFGKESSDTLRASELREYAKSKGWIQRKTETGPEIWFDQNKVKRITIKQGSPRAPKSGDPHVEIRNQLGQRIDILGNPIKKKCLENHTPIIYDIID